MSKIIIDFKKSEDPKQMRLHINGIVSLEPLPIPAAGDTVRLWKTKQSTILLRVDRRHFHYMESLTHVELYCTKIGK